jgi:Flp pilus assembly protein TadG
MNLIYHFSRRLRKKSGQTLIFFAIMVLALMLVVGLCIDAGSFYLTKASLDKAVDAAALMIVRNLYQGQAQATAVGQASFTANFKSSSATTASPALNINYGTDAMNNTTVNILSTATVSTYFLRIIPRFQTFQISSLATATRAKLVMSLILDRSGSMGNNGGGAALPGAVSAFINFFDDNIDMVALISFSSTTNLNVSMRQPFKSLVTTAANNLNFDGYTCTEGALKLAKQQNDSVVVPVNENVVKLVVLFTDGLSNGFGYTWPTNKTYNVSGSDSGSYYYIMHPTTGNVLPNSSSRYSSAPPAYCPTMTTFISTNGTTKTVSASNIRNEGDLRVLGRAAEIRASGQLVYCIGLGGGSVDVDMLKKAANTPDSSTFNPNQPVGECVIASSASQMQIVFQQIASKILLRLTR